MAAAAWGLERWLAAALPGGALPLQALRLALSIGGALLVLAAKAQVLRIREFEDVRDGILGRLRRMLRG